MRHRTRTIHLREPWLIQSASPPASLATTICPKYRRVTIPPRYTASVLFLAHLVTSPYLALKRPSHQRVSVAIPRTPPFLLYWRVWNRAEPARSRFVVENSEMCAAAEIAPHTPLDKMAAPSARFCQGLYGTALTAGAPFFAAKVHA